VLASDAETRRAAKRNHGEAPESLEAENAPVVDAVDLELLQVNAAVERLALLSPRLAQVVECRYFAGYSEAETAAALGVNERTVRRDWVKARAWLYRDLGGAGWQEPGVDDD
jgi:RNA polymerase sigma factor (sigma-70 family)